MNHSFIQKSPLSIYYGVDTGLDPGDVFMKKIGIAPSLEVCALVWEVAPNVVGDQEPGVGI